MASLSRKPLWRWIALLSLGALALGGVYAWTGVRRGLALSSHAPPPGTDPAGGAEPLEASGTVEGTLVRIASRLPGRVARVSVREGDRVRPGEELITLEGHDVRAEIEQARAQLATAAARYQEALAGTRPETLRQAEAELARAIAARDGDAVTVHDLEAQLTRSTELKQSLDAAQSQVAADAATLQAAIARLDHLKAGARPDEVREAEDAVTAAQARAQRAAAEEARMRQAYEGGAVARRDWDLAGTQRDVAAADLAGAQAHLADLRAGARPEELREAEEQVAAARAAAAGARGGRANARRLYQDRLPARQRLDAARAELRAASAAVAADRAQLDLLRHGTRPEVLRQLRGQVGEARAALALADSHGRDLHLRAPVAAVVTERDVEPGEVVQPPARLMELADLRTVWVRVYLPEKNYGRVRVGDRADVTTDSLVGQVFSGRVASIAQKAEYTPRNIQTKEERVDLMYAVKVDVANPQGALRIGMPADVQFR